MSNRKASSANPSVPPAPLVAETPPALFGTDKLDALIRVGETDVPLGDFVRAAFDAAAPMTAEEWNGLAVEDRDTRILAQVEAARAPTVEDEEATEPATSDEEWPAVIEGDDEPTQVILTVSLAGAETSHSKGDTFPCTVGEARRLRAAGFAEEA